jgi:5-methyltetrahydrofolate--homocysteine methyltransferase
LSIAQSYVDAGADIILTNSFGASPSKLRHYELDDRTAEINQAAAQISREASGEKGFVLGSMGPTGVILMMGDVPEETLYEGFCIQAKALEKGGVDGVCIETMSALDEACLAVRAVKESTSLEIACTFTFEKTVSGNFRTMMGVSPSEIVGALIEAGAAIIGTNCGNGFDGMVDIVEEIRRIDSKIPVLVHANAGKPVVQDGKTVFPETPEMMAAKIDKLIHAGANIIGGCCGTTPDHIRALAEAIAH